VLGRTSFPPGPATDGAFYDIAAVIGGSAFKFLLAVPGILLSSLAGAITAQAATARLLFGMARDGELPRALAYVDPKRKVPERTVLLVAVVTLATGLLLADQLELLTSMVNFGALLGFLLLQVSVVVHFVVRNGSRQWVRHAVVPAIGFCIIGYVLWNADANAKIAGSAWLAVGLAVFAALAVQRRLAPR
jgi:amino acid transporter